MKEKIHVSVLDLCPILSGSTPAESLKHVSSLAQHAEGLGYERFWMAEHHNMEGIGSSSPEVLIAHVAQATKKIRVGSGGIMLPNHATLHIAEAFRTLEALYPGRIDLGLGRAPGSGSKAAHALRRSRNLSADNFPEELDDLISYLNDELPETHPHHGVLAVPSKVAMPEIWILGSSDFGARLAAEKGLPYSFAQHFSHLPAIEVIKMYHSLFRPSKWPKHPKAMMGVNIICAQTDKEAQELALSTELSFALFVQSGKSIPLPSTEEAKAYPFTEADWVQIRAGSMPKIVGSPDTVRKKLFPFIKAGITEFVVQAMIYDQDARKRSYTLVKEVSDSLS